GGGARPWRGTPRRSWCAPLHEQHVPPHAVELSEPLTGPDHAESAAPVELDARDVLGEDPALDRPDAGSLGGGDERCEEPAADAVAASARVDIDTVFEHTCVHATIGDGSRRHPADERAVAHGDEAVFGWMCGRPALEGRDVVFERGVARVDALH